MKTNNKNNTVDNVENTIIETEKEKPIQPTKKKVRTGKVVNCDNLRVRSEASVNGEVVTVIPKDTVVTIESTENDFYKITSGSINGYCMKKFIK